MMLREQFEQSVPQRLPATMIQTAAKVEDESCECQSRWMRAGNRLADTRLFSACLLTVTVSHGSDSVNDFSRWDLDGICKRVCPSSPELFTGELFTFR